MALRLTDSCDNYSVAADIATRWTVVTSADVAYSSTAGVFGGGAISIGGGGTSVVAIQSRTGQVGSGNMIVGFYLKTNANPTSTQTIFNAPSNQESVQITSTGNLFFSNNTSFTTAGSYSDNKWHWIEVNYITGTVYIDNILQGGFSSPGNSPASAAFYNVPGITYSIDDIVIYDASTGAPVSANYPLGPRQITVVRPNSDQAVAFGTIVGGDGVHHYASVNEVVPDGNTSYVQDGGATTQDLLGMAALGYTPATISGVMATAYFENPNGGSINLSALCKSSATTSTGAAVATPLTYQSYQWAFGVDPNTSAAWTAAGLNAAQFGYKDA